jgi:hypothetical protein
MLKKLRPWRVWIFGGLLLVALVWIVEGSQSFQSCVQGAQYEKGEKTFQKRIADFSTLLDRRRVCLGIFLHDNEAAITALATIFIALFTLTLWQSTDRLWEASERQLTHLEGTAARQLRAYVFVSGAAVTNVAEGDGIPEAQVVIKNFGQTPAYDLVNVTGFATDVYPPPKSIRLTVSDEEFSKPISKSDLGPTLAETSTTDWKEKKRLTQVEKAALAEGKTIIFVYGEIRYVDAFGRPQWTKYRYMMGGPVGVRSGGRLAPCEEGNNAT